MGHAQTLAGWVSPDEYLRFEEGSPLRHEYLDGVIHRHGSDGTHAMVGGGKAHNRVALNVYSELRSQITGGPCEIYVADVRVATHDRSAFFYPDVVVTCSEADRRSALEITEPSLIVEVLSPSTEAFDRGAKFEAYQRLPSLRTYVLISPERQTIEIHTREAGWRRTASGPGPRPTADVPVDLMLNGWQSPAPSVFEGLASGERA